MRIGLVIEHFDGSRGGAEAYAAWLAGKLVEAGHEVHAVCHAAGKAEVAEGKVTVHALGGRKMRTGGGFREFGRRAEAICRELKFDVVHSISAAVPGDVYHSQAGCYAESQAQAVACREGAGARLFKRMMLALSGKQRALVELEGRAVSPLNEGGAMKIVSLCPMVTREYQRHHGLDISAGGRIVDLPNPLMKTVSVLSESERQVERENFRARFGMKPQDRVAVFVGHDFRRKGLRFAIEAVAKTKEWKLFVAGKGGAEPYRKLASGLGVSDRVIFLGATREMGKVYAASDVLVLPTFYDPYAFVIIEALSQGLPVISTEFLGAAYLVRDHDAGTIVATPRDSAMMAEALVRLPLPGSPEHAAMAARSREAGAKNSPEGHMQKVLWLYEQVQLEKGKLKNHDD